MSGGAAALNRLRRAGASTGTVARPTGLIGPAGGSAEPHGPVEPHSAAAGVRPDNPVGDTAERCEMCGARIVEQHSHVVHLEHRSLLCTCRPCALLFTERGAGRGRYRAVPNRYLRDPTRPMAEADWDALRIPVRMAFFFHNSDLDRTLAFYPSPAGATESLLPLDSWQGGLGGTPLAAALEPDVEALLVGQTGGVSDCLLVPIDVCYQLVGLVRLHWKGFDGGTEAWRHIEAFFAELREQARPLAGEHQAERG
ncbi:MAG TPA: DUF5947 family protein [Pseudonocardia sp.]|jgi:hypothetical protein